MEIIKKAVLILTILVIGVFPDGGSMKDKELQVAFQYNIDYWSVYDLSESSIPDRRKFEELTQNYIQEAQKLLGNYQWWKKINPKSDTLILNLTITGETNTVSRACYGEKVLDKVQAGVILSGSMLTNYHSDGFLAHELTHIMAGPSFSISLEDGLCQYVQAQIGVTSHLSGVMESGITFEQYFKIYHENCKVLAETKDAPNPQEVIDSVGRAGRQYPEGKRMMWLMYSESFVRYLISQYGVDKTMDLITTGVDEGDYEEIFGKKLTELKEEWIICTESVEQQYTYEEMEKIVSEFIQN